MMFQLFYLKDFVTELLFQKILQGYFDRIGGGIKKIQKKQSSRIPKSARNFQKEFVFFWCEYFYLPYNQGAFWP